MQRAKLVMVVTQFCESYKKKLKLKSISVFIYLHMFIFILILYVCLALSSQRAEIWWLIWVILILHDLQQMSSMTQAWF